MPRQSRAPILLTRPPAQNARFAAMLGGERVVLSPLIVPRYFSPKLPEADCVIFTSETAVRAGVARRAWCVGDRTAQAARAAGYQACSAGGDADALVAAIIAAAERGPMLHLRGRIARGNVAARLVAAGIPASEAIVYELEPQPLTPEAQVLLAGTDPVLVPLFSPDSARRFADAAKGCAAPVRFACLSAAVAAAAPPAQDVQIAAEPDACAMLTLIAAMQSLETWADEG